MLTLPVSYAKYGSGPLAEIIGWIDWKNTYLDIDTSLTDIKVPLENGLTLTFDIKNTTLLGNGYSLNPTTLSSINSPFGTLNYTEIPGNVALQIHTMYPTQSLKYIIQTVNLGIYLPLLEIQAILIIQE